MRVPLIVVSALLAALTPVGLAGQRPRAWPASWSPEAGVAHPVTPTATGEEQAPSFSLVLGGVLGLAATGVLVRATYELAGGDRICGDDACGFYAALFTSLAAEPFLVPAGVHLANRRRGSYTSAAVASAAIWVGSLIVLSKLDAPGEYIFLVPMAQIVSSVAIIQHTTRQSGGGVAE